MVKDEELVNFGNICVQDAQAQKKQVGAVMFWAKLRKNGKVLDLSLLPPCLSSLIKKDIQLAHYVAKIW